MIMSADVPPTPIFCVLTEKRAGAQVRIDIQIRSDVPLSGTYRLRVIKQGPSGNAQINQQSEFALDAGRPVQFQGLSLSMEPSARYRAVLSVTSGGTTRDCERTGPEDIGHL